MAASLTAPVVLSFPPDSRASRWAQWAWLVGLTNPSKIRVRKITLGAAAGNDVVVDAQATYQVASIPAGTVVLAVLARIITGFTALVTMTVGDGDSAAGFLASADIAPTVADTAGIYKNSLLAAEAYATGKKYLAADTIDAVIAGATPAAGKMEFLIVYLEVGQGTT